tara:strand:- start:562 stop:1494 length:933 start_codon:yes stop_codon:yes gene_type:complete
MTSSAIAVQAVQALAVRGRVAPMDAHRIVPRVTATRRIVMAAMTVVAMMPLVVGPRVMISAVLRRARKSRVSAQPHVPAGAENRRPATPVRNATTVMIVMIVVRAVRPTRDADAMLPVERLVLTNPVAADSLVPMPEMVVAVTMPETNVAVMAVEKVGEIVAEMALGAMAPEILVVETLVVETAETAIAVRVAQVDAVVPADGAAMPVMADATVADATLETVTGVHAAPAHVALAHGAVLPVMVGAILDVAVLVIVPVTAAGAMVPGSRAVAASRVANQPVVQAIAQAPRAASPQATAHAARRTNRTCGL